MEVKFISLFAACESVKFLQLLHSSSISRQSGAAAGSRGAFSLGTQFGVGAKLLNAANSNFSGEAEIKARKGMITTQAMQQSGLCSLSDQK